MVSSPDVLVIGAGPAGLTAAAEALRHGLSVRIIDQNESRSSFSKALVLHSRSLEIFQDMGFVENVLNSGRKFHALNIYVPGRRLARIVFEELEWQDALFPFWLSIPQSETERCLEDHLNKLGGCVERNTELVNLEQFEDHVHVVIKHQGGSTETLDVPWVVGCDGARSLTRSLLGLELKGKADDEVFILGDVKIDWDLPEDEGSNILSTEGILLIVPMPEARRFRIIAHMPGLSITAQPEITLELLQNLVNRRAPVGMQLSDLTWSSTFTSKHFVVSQHRQGRVFMAGDAAHIHSPVGGQGLNSGIQDAYNLMWKLALVQYGHALPGLLDTYGDERHQTAQDLITNVGRATKIVTLKSSLAQKLRNQLAGILLNTAAVRNRMSRGVAMLDISYQHNPAIEDDLNASNMLHRFLGRFNKRINGGGADFRNGPSAGMCAPNVIMSSDGDGHAASLFDFYRGTQYTLMIFSGIAGSSDIRALLELGTAIQAKYRASIQHYILLSKPSPELPGKEHIIVDANQSIHRNYGACQPCIYLIRPDQYIAYRSQKLDRDKLIMYLDRVLVRNPLAS
jgi:2-polyprenyl-6-methoxyphenol hydroxylase-like FAD-dependent oxidoreductase